MRVCLVYDCLFPHTVGGAERWYRALAAELVEAGHDVTYLTRRQWPEGTDAGVPGVRVIPVSPGGPLYTESGRRRIGPPVRFGLGVLWHLARHRSAYDAVHSCSFPYFSVLAIRTALVGRPRVRIGIDWFEVWSRGYWREYLGGVAGRIGEQVQRLCARLTPTAFVFSRLHAERLRELGIRDEPIRLAGLYAADPSAEPGADASQRERSPLVVFAGRHIPEKQAHLVVDAVMQARTQVPSLRGLILGDGPERPRVLEAIRRAGADAVVEAPGFVSSEEVTDALSRATCMMLPSLREGYGLVVLEAASHGTPSVVLAAEDNAAAELVEENVNGATAADAVGLGAAVVAIHAAGPELRARTARWFAREADRLSAASSARAIAQHYSGRA